MSTKMNEVIKAPEISTPYSYAQITNKYSLLQQQILLKVSKHLQDYLKMFFGSERAKTKISPKSLFTQEEKAHGVGQIRVSYAELGVSLNNFFMARKAASEVLGIQIMPPTKLDENGKPVKQQMLNLFTEVNVYGEGSEANAVTFNLNMDVVDLVIDMSKGYVTHPENIALIANTEKLPLLYYLLKHEMKNWKLQSVQLTVFDIKEFLGMVERTEDGKIEKISYKKFSQFKDRVIEPTLKDLQRLRDQGLLDMSFDVEYIYAGKRKVGDPTYVQFSQVVSPKKQKKQPETEQPDFAEQYQKNKNEKIWQSIVLHTESGMKKYLEQFAVEGYTNDKQMIIVLREEQIQPFEAYANSHLEEYKAMLKLASKHFGVALKGVKYKVIT